MTPYGRSACLRPLSRSSTIIIKRSLMRYGESLVRSKPDRLEPFVAPPKDVLRPPPYRNNQKTNAIASKTQPRDPNQLLPKEKRFHRFFASELESFATSVLLNGGLAGTPLNVGIT